MTGFINVNKKQGVSSAREVAVIKKLTGMPCGHMGTLDPLATGVLPIAVGNASRLFDYFLSKSKTYIATFRFGTDSDTLDDTGTIISEGGYVPDEEEITRILPRFTGEIMQVPPRYSAKCVDGRRGYQLARQGVRFELAPKKVTVHSVKLLGRVDDASYKFEIDCGGGTYIRSLARDIAAALSTCAVMSGLIRTKSGAFTIDKSVQTENLTAENISEYLIPADSVIDMNAVYVGGNTQKKLLNGCTVDCGKDDGLYKLYLEDGTFYGLCEVSQTKLKVRTKLC